MCHAQSQMLLEKIASSSSAKSLSALAVRPAALLGTFCGCQAAGNARLPLLLKAIEADAGATYTPLYTSLRVRMGWDLHPRYRRGGRVGVDKEQPA